MITTLLTTLALSSTCNTFSAKCVCYPAIPFEGFQVYVHEKCDAQEGSYRYGEQFYDTPEICEQAIKNDHNCQSL